THADELHRELELLCDREHRSTLRCAVELRDHEAGDCSRSRELACLLDSVLARGAVEHEQDLVGRARAGSPGYADDLPELVHEMAFRVETAGSVRDQRVAYGVQRLGDGLDRAGRKEVA